MMPHNLIVGITGASGAIYGIRILEEISKIKDISSHLVFSPSAKITIHHETNYKIKNIQEVADYTHNYANISSSIASGSFSTLGMIIAPCSINTMSSIATGNTNNLLSRAADVVLKERRKLLICLRETPLHSIHLENMKKLSDAGAIIFPPVPAMYLKPQSVDDVVNYTVARMLDMFDIKTKHNYSWKGIFSVGE